MKYKENPEKNDEKKNDDMKLNTKFSFWISDDAYQF